ncbi:hypothetical protein COCC4DRAFT_22491 [Bipolaris maydis ATCC 48331]|uniref:Uncharacterized protein n=2 Tax=Cochliobolus heterostrophus TaxID=5016 RepID=M2TWZ3_COCH5|nr:uncharacterized protein COCC4DRAFT_22491 [Bipolaris maydis ATCC 48331]EMD86251.1 hypothetical protein COCHEDRAFT_1034710 [Bipolaris maydis C5]ENI06199.1 hypothetical protein COCC4DRAFT_22491 [Bipolaris maydis ATCC 48331]KAH7551693.1 hypothetical protein BM1_09327 [Bipolaris maydis]
MAKRFEMSRNTVNDSLDVVARTAGIFPVEADRQQSMKARVAGNAGEARPHATVAASAPPQILKQGLITWWRYLKRLIYDRNKSADVCIGPARQGFKYSSGDVKRAKG